MRLRDSIALTLPSFLLRLVLAVTFIWTGCGKLLGTMEVSGDDAARLANLGVALAPAPAPTPAPGARPQELPTEPLESLPGADVPPTPEQGQTRNPPIAPNQTTVQPPAQEPASPRPDEGTTNTADGTSDAQPAQPAPGPNSLPSTPSTQPGEEEVQDLKRRASGLDGASLMRVQYNPQRYTSSDFPEPVTTKGLYGIALMISKAADPGLTPDSRPITPVIPTGLGNDPWPVVLAWGATITELGAGILLLLGLLTRISAAGLFVVMLVAMWMTQFGPAAIHDADAILGFIPNNQPWYAPDSYSTLMWQLALAAMALSVVFLGSGAIGLDRLLFNSSPRDPYVHGDPKGSPRTGRGGPAASGGSRSEFDRSPNPTP